MKQLCPTSAVYIYSQEPWIYAHNKVEWRDGRWSRIMTSQLWSSSLSPHNSGDDLTSNLEISPPLGLCYCLLLPPHFVFFSFLSFCIFHLSLKYDEKPNADVQLSSHVWQVKLFPFLSHCCCWRGRRNMICWENKRRTSHHISCRKSQDSTFIWAWARETTGKQHSILNNKKVNIIVIGEIFRGSKT